MFAPNNLMSGLNKTKFLVQLESCKYKCRLNEYVRDSKKNEIIINVDVNVRV